MPAAMITYVNTMRAPSSQLLRWFDRHSDTMNTESRYRYTSVLGNFKDMSFPAHQPTTTTVGIAKRAICTEDPSATAG